MTTVNKLKNAWLSNDTTNLDGTYGKVSILNEGKTELKGDTLINTKLAINKNIDSTNDYKLDVSGNVNFTGNLYKNGALFTSGITQAYADGKYAIINGSNNFTGTNTIPRINTSLTSILGSTINLSTLCQNLNFNNTTRNIEIWDDQSTGQIMQWDVSNNRIAISTINLSIVSSNDLTINCPNTTFINSTVSFPNSLVSFDDNLPTTIITSGFSNNNFITKNYGDSVYHPIGSYASLTGSNSFTGTNTFNTN